MNINEKKIFRILSNKSDVRNTGDVDFINFP